MRNRRILKNRVKYKEEELVMFDNYYDPIEPEKMKEVHAIISQRRKGYTEEQHYKFTIPEVRKNENSLVKWRVGQKVQWIFERSIRMGAEKKEKAVYF